MEPLKVIVKYTDGRMVKGTTRNFSPGADMFHVIPLDAKATEPSVAVKVGDLKAMFVVHDLDGKPNRVKQARFMGNQQVYGQKLEVTFKDGEVLEGVSFQYDEKATSFFLRPADPNSNNDRIFVVRAAVRGVRRLQPAGVR